MMSRDGLRGILHRLWKEGMGKAGGAAHDDTHLRIGCKRLLASSLEEEA